MKTAVLIGLSRHRINVDGAGITILVAFHGCPLNCKYCLNPQALSPEGVWKRFSPEELFRAVAKDDLYFRATGGGVTFGGGEPLISCKEILIFRNICIHLRHRQKLDGPGCQSPSWQRTPCSCHTQLLQLPYGQA